MLKIFGIAQIDIQDKLPNNESVIRGVRCIPRLVTPQQYNELVN